MNIVKPSIHLPEALVKAQERWSYNRQHRKGHALGYSIALSREEGAGATAVGKEIGTRLGWPVYDHELLEMIAKEMNLRVQLVESVDEKQIPWLEDCLEAFADASTVNESSFLRYLISTVLALGANGECVIVGRGSTFILPKGRALRVRLVAHLEDRIARVGKEHQLSPGEAKTFIQNIEKARLRFLQDYFRVDATDPHNYDLVLNTSYLTVPECGDLIIEGLNRLKARTPIQEPASKAV